MISDHGTVRVEAYPHPGEPAVFEMPGRSPRDRWGLREWLDRCNETRGLAGAYIGSPMLPADGRVPVPVGVRG